MFLNPFQIVLFHNKLLYTTVINQLSSMTFSIILVYILLLSRCAEMEQKIKTNNIKASKNKRSIFFCFYLC